MVDEETRRQGYGTTSYSRRSEPNEKKSTITLFSSHDIEVATNVFSDSYKIGKGVYGSVYRGYLHDTDVVIKVEVVGHMRHPNLVKLIGACISLRSLVYQFLPNGSLQDCLCDNSKILTWQVRTRIVYEICSALVFFHSQKPHPLVHGHIKPHNILLDANFRSKLSDFGICSFLSVSADTLGYIDPEYIQTGLITPACDLYSFGVTILRILTRISGADKIHKRVYTAYKENSLMTIVDPTAGKWPLNVAEHLARLGLKCCRRMKGEDSAGLTEDIMKEFRYIIAASENLKVHFEPNEKKSTITLFSGYDIEAATNGFSDSARIGIGGAYRSVYKGYLHGTEVAIMVYTEVAIKVSDAADSQGVNQFLQEMEVLAQRRHPNLVKLIGACVSLRSLVFEFLPNGSVEVCLLENPSILTWQIRTRIIYEICSALTFLHSKKPGTLVHGHIKSANILLDASFKSRLSDFGICDLLIDEMKKTTTRRTLDMDYIDPNFLETGLITPVCDLYSFGVTILRILTGKPASEIVGEVVNAYKDDRNSLMRMVDPTAGKWPLDVAEHLARLALKCCRNFEEGLTEEARLALKCCRNFEEGLTEEEELEEENPEEGLTEEEELEEGNPEEEQEEELEEENPGEGLTEEIMEELRCFLAASDNFKMFLLDIHKNPSTSSIKVFSYFDIESATDGFSESLKIGKGGYGSVYKGHLDNNTKVAIKILDVASTQGEEEFNQELEVLVQMRHPYLVKLIGACFINQSLVYEFLPKGSLEDWLINSPTLLTWQIRTRIVYQICSALVFLHSNKPQPLLHGDLKPDNVLLDDNFNIKLADFGLCRFLPEGTNTQIFHKTKNFKGTEWYIDPDYLETGNLSPGCDVYSFGITILRILTGKPPDYILREVSIEYRVNKPLTTMVDSTAGAWPNHVAKYLARIGLRCCDPKGRSRSELMMEISSGLENILAEIGS